MHEGRDDLGRDLIHGVGEELAFERRIEGEIVEVVRVGLAGGWVLDEDSDADETTSDPVDSLVGLCGRIGIRGGGRAAIDIERIEGFEFLANRLGPRRLCEVADGDLDPIPGHRAVAAAEDDRKNAEEQDRYDDDHGQFGRLIPETQALDLEDGGDHSRRSRPVKCKKTSWRLGVRTSISTMWAPRSMTLSINRTRSS